MAGIRFRDREEAARELAHALDRFRGTHPLVLAIPRGAVPMGRLIADALGGELDVALVKKIGDARNPEFAIGSVDEAGNVVPGEGAAWSGADPAYIRAEAARQLGALRERAALYRGTREAPSARGRVVIVLDDGAATGATMAAALRAARRQGAATIVCAVPVASQQALALLRPLADALVCLATPRVFGAVGYYYADFSPVDDRDVVCALTGSEQELDVTNARAGTRGF